MDDQNLKSFLHQLLSEGKVKKAIKIFLSWSKKNESELHKNLITLSSRYARYEAVRRLSTGTKENLETEINQINYVLLEYIDEKIPDDIKNFEADLYAGIDSELDDKKLSYDTKLSFLQWLAKKSNTGINIAPLFVVIGFIGLFLSILTITNGIQQISRQENYTWMNYYAHFGNLILAIMAVFVIPKIKLSDEFKKKIQDLKALSELTNQQSNNTIVTYFERAEKALKEFKWSWWLVWVGFLLLYVVFVVVEFPSYFSMEADDSFIKDKEYSPLKNIFTHVSSLGFIMCFSILFYKNEASTKKHSINSITLYTFCFLVILSIIDIIALNHSDLQLLFKIIAGIIACVSIALLIGRLDSKILNVPVWIILLIFFYAGVQLLTGYFDLYPGLIGYCVEYKQDSDSCIQNIKLTDIQKNLPILIESFALNFALFSKALFFLLIYWLINEGKLILYIVRLNSLLDEKDTN